jgi:hypothetical protein
LAAIGEMLDKKLDEKLDQKLDPVNKKLAALETGQQRIEATVNDIRSTNRKTHKEVFSRLDYIVEDLKRLEPHEEKAIR